ncbi:MAG TPA: hypothetical protein VG838_07505 [Opitutaceae bacterium]|nr:hypothetical protein [Opitutaceae bacterium]
MKALRITAAVLAWTLMLAAARGSVLFEQVKKEYADKAGIELLAGGESFPVDTAYGRIDGTNAGANDIDLFLYMFRKEFGKYPPELLKLSGLKRIVFCSDLLRDGARRSGIAVSDSETIYLNVRSGVFSERFRRKLMHHEFFHIIDFASFGFERDTEWEALNPPGTTYNPAAANAAGHGPSSDVTHPAPGFLTRYSLADSREEKAELFSNLMFNDLQARDFIKRDGVLTLKVELMKARLAKFCPQLDAGFWARAIQP